MLHIGLSYNLSCTHVLQTLDYAVQSNQINRLHGDGVDDGTRTHDDRNHNPGLYQLSYIHHWINRLAQPVVS